MSIGDGSADTQPRFIDDPILDHIFHRQEALMRHLGIKSHEEEHVDVYHPEFLAACIGLASEASEILDEINVVTRPWAVKSDDEVRDALAKEAIDVLFYFVEIMIFLRVTPYQLLDMYEEKWRINTGRVLSKSK